MKENIENMMKEKERASMEGLQTELEEMKSKFLLKKRF